SGSVKDGSSSNKDTCPSGVLYLDFSVLEPYKSVKVVALTIQSVSTIDPTFSITLYFVDSNELIDLQAIELISQIDFHS
ncbi:hypothetical protein ACFTQ8_21625, partial [Heyndrickxia sporothermodurans]|uniref:hypothetical protein n=1 Tax=Heyndrickxia sporothermodurans TaxID=46224 RepID=UPI0035E17004